MELGAYFAVPELLDPTLDTAALLGLGALHAMFWGGILVAIVGVYFTSKALIARLTSKRVGVVAAVGLVVMGFAFRVQRGLLEDFNAAKPRSPRRCSFLWLIRCVRIRSMVADSTSR